MAEYIHINNELSKAEKYEDLLPQMFALLDANVSAISNLANTSAALKSTFNFLWVGFYKVVEHNLELGPFQGSVACTIIPKGKGVCGTAWSENKSIIVPNVEAFSGHISCSPLSKSEIVIPIRKNNKVVWIFDVDSEYLKYFDKIDEKYLSEIATKLEQYV